MPRRSRCTLPCPGCGLDTPCTRDNGASAHGSSALQRSATARFPGRCHGCCGAPCRARCLGRDDTVVVDHGGALEEAREEATGKRQEARGPRLARVAGGGVVVVWRGVSVRERLRRRSSSRHLPLPDVAMGHHCDGSGWLDTCMLAHTGETFPSRFVSFVRNRTDRPRRNRSRRGSRASYRAARARPPRRTCIIAIIDIAIVVAQTPVGGGDLGRKKEEGRRKTEDGRWTQEAGRMKNEEGRMKKEEGRRRKEEGRRKKEG